MSTYARVILAIAIAAILIVAVYPPGKASASAGELKALNKKIIKLQKQLDGISPDAEVSLNSSHFTEMKEDFKLEVQQEVKREMKKEAALAVESIQVRPSFLKPDMVEVIKKRSVKGDIVFLSADFNYREVLLNWIVVAESKNISNWIISCYDEELQTWLQQRGMTCHIAIPKQLTSLALQDFEIIENRHCKGQMGATQQAESLKDCMSKACSRFYTTDCIGVMFSEKTKNCTKCHGDPRIDFVSALPMAGTNLGIYTGNNRIWHLRWRAAMDVFSLGLNVAFVDLDAIIVQDFFPFVRGLNTDVVAQRGYGPAKASAIWGNSICMGFSYWKQGNSKRNEIIRSVNEVLKKSGDDQNAVANALLIEGVRFPVKTQPNDTETRKGFSPSGYSLALLPMTTFPRGGCKEGQMVPPKYIAHCVFGGTPKVKQREITKFGTWKLRGDYESFSSKKYSTFKEYITAIHSATPTKN